MSDKHTENVTCNKCGRWASACVCDAPSELAAPSSSANFTLTAEEIRHLAQFCGMVLQEPTASEAEDERETEIIIASWPEKGVKGDDGMLPPHKHIAYLAEYPEEGCVPLGSPNADISHAGADATKLN